MFLKNITVNKSVELDSTRKEHKKRFKMTSTRETYEDRRSPLGTPKEPWERQKYKKRTRTYKFFTLFEKGLSVDFDTITVLVGDNGTGKTSFMNMLKFPDMSMLYFAQDPEQAKKDAINEWYSDDERTLTFSALPGGLLLGKEIHKNSFISDIKGSKAFLDPHDVMNMFDMSEASNGENTLDFINGISEMSNCIIVLDEPETSLSIKSQRAVAKIIKEMAKKNQVIIITHSPILMGISDTVYDFETKSKVNTQEYIKKQME